MAALSVDDAARQQRAQQRRELAVELAQHVGGTAYVTQTGNIELDPVAMMRLAAACSAARTLTFGELGSVSSKRFAAVMRAGRDTTLLSVAIRPAGLALRYTTPRSRGGIVFKLHCVTDGAAIVVPLHVAVVEAPRVEPPPALEPRAQQPPYTPAPHRRGPWLRRLAEALRTHHYG